MSKFEDIEAFVEQKHFVEYRGDFFCIKESCEGCKYQSECEFEDGDIEVTENIAVRQCIGVDNNTAFESDSFYFPHITEKQLKNANDVNLRWEHPDGHLPDSKLMIYKIVKNLAPADSEYILYNPDDKKNYCIRQICSECPLFKTCEVEVFTAKKSYITVAHDLKSQEPRVNTFVTREPVWVKTFRNDSLREKSEIFVIYEKLFETHPSLMVDTQNSKVFWTWMDKQFFYDKTEAYRLNNAVLKLQANPESKKIRRELEAIVDNIVEAWDNYLADRKARKEKKKK